MVGWPCVSHFVRMNFDYTPYLIYWSIGAAFFLAEWLYPARPIRYRLVIVRDLVALGTYNLFFLAAISVTDRIAIPNYVPWRFEALPFAAKLVVFVLLVDCSAYWLHRLWHTTWFWRVHQWHHAPTYMYWLAGIRASLPQVIMAGIPFVVAAPTATIDPDTSTGAAVTIEYRDPDEVLLVGGWRMAPAESGALNPAFDMTPADLVTAIVTESRVIEPPRSAEVTSVVHAVTVPAMRMVGAS